MSFIYCIDEQTKNTLLAKGYKLLKQERIADKTAFVFEYKPQITFDIVDTSKYFVSNRFRF